MNNSKFWNDGATTPKVSTGAPAPKTKGPTKLAKGLGVTGIVVLVLVAILGFFVYMYAIRPATVIIGSVNTLKKNLNDMSSALESRDLVELDLVLTKTQNDLGTLRKDREEKFGWAKDVKLFRINEFYADSDHFINAGLYAIDAAKELETVVIPFADAAGLKVSADQEVPETEGLMEAFQSWITLMPQVAGQMDGVIEKLTRVGKELENVDVSKYPEEIRGVRVRSNIEFLKTTLSQTNVYGDDIKLALTIFPRVLGVGTPAKRYMVIMQNDKELRPTGGFMTGYATFRMENAMLVNQDFSSHDMYSIDDTLDIIDATYDFPDAPVAYQKYLGVERWYARDMNSSPDFQTSMDQFLEFYNMAGRISPMEIKAVDGIFAIDTQVIAELLDITGPVTVNGVTYTKDNVVLELERIASLALREQQNRKKVLGDLMKAMLANVFESEKDMWSSIIDKGVDLAVRKHIQLYLFDVEAQALADKYGLGGRVLQEYQGDYLNVVSTNLGGDKTNWFVTKEVNTTVGDAGDKVLRTVTLKYSYPQPSDEYGPFIKRFKDWVRVYVPLGSELVSVEGTEDGYLSDQELDKTYFTGYIELGPGETKEMKFTYYLPSDVKFDSEYVLTIQKQAGIDSNVYTITTNKETKTLDLFKDTVIRLGL